MPSFSISLASGVTIVTQDGALAAPALRAVMGP
jgi:hypothetical protein